MAGSVSPSCFLPWPSSSLRQATGLWVKAKHVLLCIEHSSWEGSGRSHKYEADCFSARQSYSFKALLVLNLNPLPCSFNQ